MLTDPEVDALARDILTEVITNLKRGGYPQFIGFHETETNGPIIAYSTNRKGDGDGDVLCEFAPLNSVKSIIRVCESYAATFAIDVINADTKQLMDKVTLPHDRQPRLVEDMAANAALRLVANFRVRLSDTLDEAVQDSLLIASSFLASVEAGHLTKLTNDQWPATAYVQEPIEVAAQRVAEKKRLALREELAQLPNLVLERGRGRKAKPPGQREQERQQYSAKVEEAYRLLRVKGGKPPTKVSVAGELGEGGQNRKTGSDTRLNSFNLKLGRLQIKYDEIAKKVEDDLHNKP